MRMKLSAGGEYDVVSPAELDASNKDLKNYFRQALQENIRGVKSIRAFFPLPANLTAWSLNSNGGMLVPSGFVWALMNVGIEGTASTNIRIYLNDYLGVVGNNRLIGATSSAATVNSLPFSKGQAMLKGGEWFSVVASSPSIQSVSFYAIEVLAEREGELLI